MKFSRQTDWSLFYPSFILVLSYEREQVVLTYKGCMKVSFSARHSPELLTHFICPVHCHYIIVNIVVHGLCMELVLAPALGFFETDDTEPVPTNFE